MTLSEFLHMGGYGGYVWSAYAIWLVVMVANVAQPLLKSRSAIRRLSGALSEQGGRP